MVARRDLSRHDGRMSDIRDSLWNINVSQCDYDRTASCQAAVFKQYKLWAEIADRVSAQRNSSNTFFLSLNTAVGTFYRMTSTAGEY